MTASTLLGLVMLLNPFYTLVDPGWPDPRLKAVSLTKISLSAFVLA